MVRVHTSDRCAFVLPRGRWGKRWGEGNERACVQADRSYVRPTLKYYQTISGFKSVPPMYSSVIWKICSTSNEKREGYKSHGRGWEDL